MMRYLKLYLRFLEFSFGQGLQFRIDFFTRVIMDVIFYSVVIGFNKIIFTHTDMLGGWTEGQMMIFICGYLVTDALIMTVITNNTYMLPQFIRTGQLDFYLVRPVNSLFFLSLRSFSASSFFNLLIACGLLIYSLTTYSDQFHWQNLPVFLLLILNGTFLAYVLLMYFSLLSFWTQAGAGDFYVAWEFSKFAEQPHTIFKNPLRLTLLTILPYSLLNSLPASYLFGHENWKAIFHILIVTALHFLFLLFLWKRGLSRYSSASS